MTVAVESWKEALATIQNPSFGARPEENVVLLPTQAAAVIQEPSPQAQSPQSQDWSEAVSLVLEAAEAIRTSETRVREAEDRCVSISADATREIQRLGQSLLAAERRLAAAEERALDAQRRCAEAENRLNKLYTAVTHSFSPLLKGQAKDQSTSFSNRT
jgi:small-conductance mechanosensitive channel